MLASTIVLTVNDCHTPWNRQWLCSHNTSTYRSWSRLSKNLLCCLFVRQLVTPQYCKFIASYLGNQYCLLGAVNRSCKCLWKWRTTCWDLSAISETNSLCFLMHTSARTCTSTHLVASSPLFVFDLERCQRCQSVFPSEGVQILEAMGKTWHIQCFRYVYILHGIKTHSHNTYVACYCHLTCAQLPTS